jgi:citronellol/citronellal dehydrogenase
MLSPLTDTPHGADRRVRGGRIHMPLSGKTMFISGASRGIGLAIAKRAAADGANVALVAKTAEPHPKLDGTVYTAAKEIEDVGGHALPIVGDVRDAESVEAAVAKAVEQFGAIDICVNNASAINLGSITDVPLKRFDLMNGIQVRGTYAVSQACIPHMLGRDNPHILTLSPPIRLESEWLKPTAYMMAKFGMTLCALGIAEELRADGIASNTLWPRTLVATAAVQNLLGGSEAMARARKPDVYADAAYAVLNMPAASYTGQSLLCEDVLLESGVTDLSVYDCVPGADLGLDLWVDSPNPPGYTPH